VEKVAMEFVVFVLDASVGGWGSVGETRVGEAIVEVDVVVFEVVFVMFAFVLVIVVEVVWVLMLSVLLVWSGRGGRLGACEKICDLVFVGAG
jgi:hypothetical protein